MNKQREHAIRVVISINGAKCTTTLGFSVDKEVWQRGDLSAYQNSRGVNGADIQLQMKRLQDGIKAWEGRLYGRRPSTQEIRTRMRRILFNEEDVSAPPVDILRLVDAFIAEQRILNQWSKSTVKQMCGFRRHLSRFCPAGADCDFFDEPGLEAWLRYLRESARMEESTVQKMYKYLKELCELCGIKSPIAKVLYRNGVRHETVYPKYALVGTHAARRTFICFALSQGIPPQVVMKWTGHADYQSMRPYIDVASGVTAAAMRKLSAAWK